MQQKALIFTIGLNFVFLLIESHKTPLLCITLNLKIHLKLFYVYYASNYLKQKLIFHEQLLPSNNTSPVI